LYVAIDSKIHEVAHILTHNVTFDFELSQSSLLSIIISFHLREIANLVLNWLALMIKISLNILVFGFVSFKSV
jgi:hypothetical protein